MKMTFDMWSVFDHEMQIGIVFGIFVNILE